MLELRPGQLSTLLIEERGGLVLDLSEVTWAFPHSLVALATQTEVLVNGGAQLTVRAPRSVDVARYLARAHLPHVLDELGVSHDFNLVRERDLGVRIVELARFTGESGVRTLAESAHAFALPVSDAAAGALHTAVCEAGENVTTHAGVTHGYMMAQYYPANGRFRFALADSGIGFHASLQAAGATDAAHALELAAQPGVSSTGDPTRGLGIDAIRHEILELGGIFQLATEDQGRRFDSSAPEGRPWAAQGSIIGSLVYGSFQAASPYSIPGHESQT